MKEKIQKSGMDLELFYAILLVTVRMIMRSKDLLIFWVFSCVN